MRVAGLPSWADGPALTLSEASVPDITPDDVLIEVVAAGVNRADLLQVKGLYPPPAGAPDWPGLEVAGIVREVGDAVTRWSAGDEVCALLPGGGYAEYAVVNHALVLPAPSGVSLVDAAGLVESACTVWSNLRAAAAMPGQSILVHGGAGGIGTMAVQYAAALGLTVFATAGTDAKARLCRELGAADVFNYATDDWSAILAERGGVDIVLDVMGASHLERNLTSLAVGGRLAVIGLQGGRRAEIDLGTMLSRRLSVIGTTLRSRPLAERTEIVAGVERDVWPLIPERIRPVTHATFPLADAAAALAALESGEVAGKLVLTVRD